MDLKEIMSVSGYSGLFRFVSQGRNGIIVESFADKKRMFVNATQKVSSLADIAIFTTGEEIPLKDVFKKIHEKNAEIQIPDPKSSPDELKKFMEEVLPEYDRDRVYVSDIKKLVSWYKSLAELNLLSFDNEETKEEEAVTDTENKAPAEENETEKKEQPAEKAAKPKQPSSKKPSGKSK